MWKPTQPLKRRLLKEFWCLVALGLAFLIYREFLGPRLMPVLEAHNVASNMPAVNVVPQPLSNLTPSAAPGTTITAYGNTFEVPWKDIVWRRVLPELTAITFATHRGLRALSAKYKLGPPEWMFDDYPKTSAFDHESLMWNATPPQVRFFDSPRISAQRALLLLNKGILGDDELRSGVYEFQTPVTRGFQIGNPASSGRIYLDFFDSGGNSLGEIDCSFGNENPGTQAELNRIIQTFHPVTTTAPASASAANQSHPSAH